MSSTTATQDLTATANVYSLLARLWLSEVDSEWLEQLNRSDLRSRFVDAGGFVPSAEDLDLLACEYCDLFIGPRGHLAPYQSVWERGELQSEIVASVDQFITLIGYVAPSPRTLSDHFGRELDMMATALRLSDRLPKQDEDVGREIAAEFFVRHLTWADGLLRAVAERADSDFYRGLANMTAEFLCQERDLRMPNRTNG